MSHGWCRRCITAWAKDRNRELRTDALIAYSDGNPSCACCGENRFEFLSLDHIDGGGNAHRRAVSGGSPKGGTQFYYWLRDHHYPPGFQVLCHNCNMAKHIYGACPYAQDEHAWQRARLNRPRQGVA